LVVVKGVDPVSTTELLLVELPIEEVGELKKLAAGQSQEVEVFTSNLLSAAIHSCQAEAPAPVSEETIPDDADRMVNLALAFQNLEEVRRSILSEFERFGVNTKADSLSAFIGCLCNQKRDFALEVLAAREVKEVVQEPVPDPPPPEPTVPIPAPLPANSTRVSKGNQVLACLKESSQPLHLREISAKTGISIETVTSCLSILKRHGGAKKIDNKWVWTGKDDVQTFNNRTSLDTILTTAVSILRDFEASGRSAFSARDLSSELGKSPGAISPTLRGLHSRGLITPDAKGNWHVNREALDLQSDFMPTGEEMSESPGTLLSDSPTEEEKV